MAIHSILVQEFQLMMCLSEILSKKMWANMKRERIMNYADLIKLEPRQYKNGFVSVKRMLVLKFPPFFPCRVGEGKRAANSKQT